MRAKYASSVLIAVVLSWPGCRSGRTHDAPGAATDDLRRKAVELNTAVAHRDVSKLLSLMAPDYEFHFVDTDRTVMVRTPPPAPRGRWLEDVFRQVSNGPFEFAIVDTRVERSLGIVVTYYTWRGSFAGVPFYREGYVTDVWTHRTGKWELLISSATLVAADK